jgi:GT2 family glycosyltransferase
MITDLSQASRICSFQSEIRQELLTASAYEVAHKDILIVVHNQLVYLKNCVESIRQHTEDYKLYVWDNASNEETKDWLADQKDITVLRSRENLGFIVPNNRMAAISQSPYLIFLNSDTLVYPGWEKAMIAFLQRGFSQVGYMGGYLDHQGFGAAFGFGSKCDYISGWCFAIPRTIYQRFGLFDEENLDFAYCEDADLSLRLREAGLTIHALHLGLVYHYQNKTITEVAKVRDCSKSIAANHLYLQKRWKRFLPGVPAGRTNCSPTIT